MGQPDVFECGCRIDQAKKLEWALRRDLLCGEEISEMFCQKVYPCGISSNTLRRGLFASVTSVTAETPTLQLLKPGHFTH